MGDNFRGLLFHLILLLFYVYIYIQFNVGKMYNTDHFTNLVVPSKLYLHLTLVLIARVHIVPLK